MKKFVFCILLLLTGFSLNACTSIIISGRATADGRPILWKNRDTDHLDNRLMFFNDGKFTYTGLVNSADKTGNEVWAGMNSAGFCIMNTASYNLDNNPAIRPVDREGEVMKLALQQCATLEDFEQLLKNMKKPMGVEANFGVIDAKGGAAFYEVNHFQVKKLDVNDKAIAPLGYIIHTNFSFTGNDKDGMGYIRYMAAENVFSNLAMVNELNVKNIVQKGSRCLVHGLTKVDLNSFNTPHAQAGYFWFTDFIPRYSTSAAITIQGVLPDEKPELTVLWLTLGFPLTSLTLPVLNTNKVAIPAILLAAEKDKAPLCNWALELKSRCFPMKRENGRNYVYLPVLFNYLAALLPVENELFLKSNQELNQFRKANQINPDELLKMYEYNSTLITNTMNGLIRN